MMGRADRMHELARELFGAPESPSAGADLLAHLLEDAEAGRDRLLDSYPRSLWEHLRALPEFGDAASDLDLLIAELPEPVYRHNNLAMPFRPARVSTPGRLRRVLRRMADAPQGPGALRAVGDGYGFSTASHTKGEMLRLADRFDQIESVAPALLRDPSQADGLVWIEAGVRFAELNRWLHRRDRALWNQPGYDRLTVVGAAGTGGHGSGSWLAPLADQLLSLDVARFDRVGALVVERIEPAGGITDPVAFAEAFPDRRLTQDDRRYAAAMVHLGALGVVVGATVATRGAYWLSEQREAFTWAELRAPDGPLARALDREGPDEPGRLHSVEVWVNPYTQRCVLGTRAWTEQTKKSGTRGVGVRVGSAAMFRVLAAIMRARPQTIPSLLDAGLDSCLPRNGAPVVRQSQTALDFGAPNTAPVLASDSGVPAADFGKLVDTLDDLLSWIQAQEGEGMRVTSPLGLRFVGGSRAYLSPAHGRERTCMIEMPILAGTPKAPQMLEAYQRRMMDRHAGRPHWGQVTPIQGRELVQLYDPDGLSAVAEAFGDCNPLGAFDNGLTEALGFHGLRGPVGSPCDDVERRYRSYSELFADARSPQLTRALDGADVVAALQRARRQGRPLCVVAGESSLHNQALGVGRHYLAVDCLNGMEIVRPDGAPPHLVVGAGARWGAVVDHTLEAGLLPRIIVTTTEATVGGTLSANSIARSSRLYGHEADATDWVRLVVWDPTPGSPGFVERQVWRPDPADTSADAALYRAAVGGFGGVGVLTAARLQLVALEDGAMAVTRVSAHDRAADAVAELRPTGPDDRRSSSCALFLDATDAWMGATYHTELRAPTPDEAAEGKRLLIYAGNTAARAISEAMLAAPSTARVAHRIAARASRTYDRKERIFVDEVRDFVFVMQPNRDFKQGLQGRGREARGGLPTLQQTFVVPPAAMPAFLDAVFAALRDNHPDRAPGEDALEGADLDAALAEEVSDLLEKDPELAWFLAEEEHVAQQAERLLEGEVPTPTADFDLSWAPGYDRARVAALTADALKRARRVKHLVPALFEAVWVPASSQDLSSAQGEGGYAISLAFQGAFLDPDSWTARTFPRARAIGVAVRQTLRALSATCVAQGGAVHLTKNVLLPLEDGDPGPFAAEMLGEGLTRYQQTRRRWQPPERRDQPLLATRFIRAFLGG